MRASTISMNVDGINVECDGPVEALDEVQRDALEVRTRLAEEANEEVIDRVGKILGRLLRARRERVPR